MRNQGANTYNTHLGSVSKVIDEHPLGSTTMQDLFSQPHETNEGTQCACHYETALETVAYHILPVNKHQGV